MKPAPPLESAVQAQIVQALRLSGWLVLEMQKGSQRGGSVWCTKGIPDLFACKAGHSVWLEVKRPSLGRLSPAQAALHTAMRAEGVEVHVVTSPEEALGVLSP